MTVPLLKWGKGWLISGVVSDLTRPRHLFTYRLLHDFLPSHVRPDDLVLRQATHGVRHRRFWELFGRSRLSHHDPADDQRGWVSLVRRHQRIAIAEAES